MTARRGLLAVALLLLLFIVLADLLRPGSFLVQAWRVVNPSSTRMERAVDDVHRSRPAPRRVNGADGVHLLEGVTRSHPRTA